MTTGQRPTPSKNRKSVLASPWLIFAATLAALLLLAGFAQAPIWLFFPLYCLVTVAMTMLFVSHFRAETQIVDRTTPAAKRYIKQGELHIKRLVFCVRQFLCLMLLSAFIAWLATFGPIWTSLAVVVLVVGNLLIIGIVPFSNNMRTKVVQLTVVAILVAIWLIFVAPNFGGILMYIMPVAIAIVLVYFSSVSCVLYCHAQLKQLEIKVRVTDDQVDDFVEQLKRDKAFDANGYLRAPVAKRGPSQSPRSPQPVPASRVTDPQRPSWTAESGEYPTVPTTPPRSARARRRRTQSPSGN